MSKRNDITTPAGYFEDLQQRLEGIPARKKVSPSGAVVRIAPYAAIAASFVAIVMIGSAILRPTAVPAEDDTWTYVSYLADALDPDGAALVDTAAWDEEEEEGLYPEDIVNFLLADGISVEHLNYLSYEEGY
jgi:hypothetical protein